MHILKPFHCICHCIWQSFQTLFVGLIFFQKAFSFWKFTSCIFTENYSFTCQNNKFIFFWPLFMTVTLYTPLYMTKNQIIFVDLIFFEKTFGFWKLTSCTFTENCSFTCKYDKFIYFWPLLDLLTVRKFEYLNIWIWILTVENIKKIFSDLLCSCLLNMIL